MITNKNYILLTTIEHTGTMFTINILEKAGYSLFHHKDLESLNNLQHLASNTVLHTHIPPVHNKSYVDDPKYTPFKNIIDKIYLPLTQYGKCRMVISIRDPLASLITRAKRYPHFSRSFLVDSFLSLVKESGEFHPFFLFIDLFKDERERMHMLSDLESFLESSIQNKKTIAREWQPINTRGLYRLKEAYFQRDVDYIQNALPEWNYLVKHRKTLQPFFEAFGYRNLLWFNK